MGKLKLKSKHRLLCGDSTSEEDVARLMDGQKADMVFTDPPYGIDYDDSRWNEIQKKHTGKTSQKFGKIVGDSKEFDPSFIVDYFDKVSEVFVWGYENYPDKLGKGGVIVWNRKTEKQKDVPYADFELCWSKHKRNKMCWLPWGGFKNKDEYGKRVHPTQKPVALAQWFFSKWGKSSDVVWDGFLGSGSTLIACEQLNRKCYGMEIDPLYCDVIVKRWENLTGETATLDSAE